MTAGKVEQKNNFTGNIDSLYCKNEVASHSYILTGRTWCLWVHKH